MIYRLKLILAGILVALGAGAIAQVGGGSGVSASPTRDASLLTLGELADARLSSNVALYDGSMSQFTVGVLPDARLSANVPLLDRPNSFNAVQRIVTSDPRMCLVEDDVADTVVFTRVSGGVFRIYGVQGLGCTTVGADFFLSAQHDGSSFTSVSLNADVVAFNGNRLHKTARGAVSATGVLSDDYSVSGVTKTGTGEYTVDLTAAGFAADPVCVVTVGQSSLVAFVPTGAQAPTATSLVYKTTSLAGSLTDSAAQFICLGF